MSGIGLNACVTVKLGGDKCEKRDEHKEERKPKREEEKHSEERKRCN